MNTTYDLKMHFAIEPGWFWMIIPPGITSTGIVTPEIACIYKGDKCVALLHDRKEVDVRPGVDPMEKNIIDTIISANLGY